MRVPQCPERSRTFRICAIAFVPPIRWRSGMRDSFCRGSLSHREVNVPGHRVLQDGGDLRLGVSNAASTAPGSSLRIAASRHRRANVMKV
jgi:hypothetical protein